MSPSRFPESANWPSLAAAEAWRASSTFGHGRGWLFASTSAQNTSFDFPALTPCGLVASNACAEWATADLCSPSCPRGLFPGPFRTARIPVCPVLGNTLASARLGPAVSAFFRGSAVRRVNTATHMAMDADFSDQGAPATPAR
jgi:hypothetical protein